MEEVCYLNEEQERTIGNIRGGGYHVVGLNAQYALVEFGGAVRVTIGKDGKVYSCVLVKPTDMQGENDGRKAG